MLNSLHRFGLLVSFLAVFGASGNGQELPPQAEWVAFASDDGKLAATFPKAPKENTQNVDSPIGKLKVTMHAIETPNSSFMVSHLTYPVDPMEYDVQAGLEGAVKGAAGNIGGTIVESGDIKQSGFPGKEILIQGKQDIFVKARMYIDPKGPTLFQGLVVGSKELVSSKDATFFLDSIKVK